MVGEKLLSEQCLTDRRVEADFHVGNGLLAAASAILHDNGHDTSVRDVAACGLAIDWRMRLHASTLRGWDRQDGAKQAVGDGTSAVREPNADAIFPVCFDTNEFILSPPFDCRRSPTVHADCPARLRQLSD
jgi:hypothetical protein